MSRFNHAVFDRSASGTAYAKISIDGERYVAFKDAVLETTRGIKMGAEVEFKAKPASKPGGNPVIEEIRVVGDSKNGTEPATPGAKADPIVAAPTDEKRRQMSIMYRYATDIVAALPLAEPVSHETAADLVSKLAKQLFEKYESDIRGGDASKAA